MSETEVIGTRVGSGYKQRFNDMCAKIGATPREVMENLVDDYFACRFSMSGGHIENGLSTRDESDFDDEGEYHDLGFDTLVRVLRQKEYPDEYIKKMVDSMVGTALDMPRYNPKRKSEEWGC